MIWDVCDDLKASEDLTDSSRTSPQRPVSELKIVFVSLSFVCFLDCLVVVQRLFPDEPPKMSFLKIATFMKIWNLCEDFESFHSTIEMPSRYSWFFDVRRSILTFFNASMSIRRRNCPLGKNPFRYLKPFDTLLVDFAAHRCEREGRNEIGTQYYMQSIFVHVIDRYIDSNLDIILKVRMT